MANQQTIGGTIDKLHALRETKREHEEIIKEIQRTMDALEVLLLKQMEAEGVSKASGQSATVSVGESVKPSVENWDRFYEFIHKNRYYHLLERRPSVTGCRELFETKGSIPGVTPFVQRKVNMRSID